MAAPGALSLHWAARGGRPRPFASHRLFHARPTLDDVRLAQGVGWLELIVLLVWATPAVIGSAFLARRMWAARARIGAGSRDGRYWETGVRVALVLGVAAVAVRATLGRSCQDGIQNRCGKTTLSMAPSSGVRTCGA